MSITLKRLSLFFIAVFVIGLVVFFWPQIWNSLVLGQRQVNRVINLTIRDLSGQSIFSTKVFWLFLFSVGYGVIHAAGPGHGKLVLCTNLLDKKKNIRSAIVGSSCAALTHVVGAGVLTIVFKLVLEGASHFTRMNVNSNLIKVNGVVIILLGVVTLLFTFSKKLADKKRKVQNDKLVGVLAGMVPCPATMTLLMISLATGVLWAGLLAVGGIVLGIFVTLTIPGILIVLFRDRVLGLFVESNKKVLVFKIVGLLQAFFFILIGLIWIV